MLENWRQIGQREVLQLFMQMTGNVVEMQDLRKNLMDIEDKVPEIIYT